MAVTDAGTSSRVAVIDADTHITEPIDLWTSRVPRKWIDQVPRVEIHPTTKHNHWRIGDHWLQAVGYFAQAGWKEYPPFNPWELDEVDKASYDPAERLKRMDEYGVDKQLLYPNIIGFQAPLIRDLGPEISIVCTEAYNDFLLEFASVDPKRFVPIGMIPFWDIEASIREMKRCAERGVKGFLFANKYEKIGLPSFVDPYWDPIYAAAQDADLSINYHIGFSAPEMALALSAETFTTRQADVEASRRAKAQGSASGLMSQGDILATILTSGLCDRFPRLKLVSVESGFGYVPYLVESLDWHWKANGNHLNNDLLPSDYFRRQCYGTFWFERSTLRLLDLFPDNFMWSTDFPHPTSVSPGPCSPADHPIDHINIAFEGLDEEIKRKALSENAVRVYNLD